MKEPINSEELFPSIGPYSQAIKIKDTVYVSGQIPTTQTSSSLVSKDFEEQTTQVFKNLSSIANAAGGSLQNFVKCNIYLTDMKNFSTLNRVMQKFFASPYPVRTTVEVSALPKNALIEIEGIMHIETETYE